MGSPGQQSPDSGADSLTKVPDKPALTQVLTFKASIMQRLIQVMQAAVLRSCTTACQLFCLPVAGKKKRFPDQTLQDNNAKDQLHCSPSTVLIVNISNSTLINCVIGDSHASAGAERQPLMEEPGQQAAELRCSYCHRRQEAALAAPSEPHHPPAEHLNINIQDSCLNSVIVGDNNYMHVQKDD